MESKVKKEDNGKGEIYSVSVRAGKRTYFFDIKATRQKEYYLTITERMKRFREDGKFTVEKHKMFLYKEDFEKFKNGLDEAFDFIANAEAKEANNEIENEAEGELVFADSNYTEEKKFTDIEFEDLIN